MLDVLETRVTGYVIQVSDQSGDIPGTATHTILHLFCQVRNGQYDTCVCSELPHLKKHLQVPQAKEIS
jgi:hypothetical protein